MTVLSEDTLHIQKKTRDREKHVPMETVARRNVPRTGRNLQQNQTQWDTGGRGETGEGEIRERRGGDGKTGGGERKAREDRGNSRVGVGDPATDSGKS